MEPVTTETRVALVDELACREVLPAERVAEAKAVLRADTANPIAVLTTRFQLPPREVLSAACAVTQLPPAPLAWLRGDNPPDRPASDDEVAAFLAIGAVPLGHHRGTLCVAFADPEDAIAQRGGLLPPHKAHLALESDLRSARARIQAAFEVLPDETVRTTPVSEERADDEPFSPRPTTVGPPAPHRFGSPTLVDAESSSGEIASFGADFEDAPTVATTALPDDSADGAADDADEGWRADPTVAALVERPHPLPRAAITAPTRRGDEPLDAGAPTWVSPPAAFDGSDDEDLFEASMSTAPAAPAAQTERRASEAEATAPTPSSRRAANAPSPPAPAASRAKLPSAPRSSPRPGDGARASSPRGVGRYRTLGVLGRGGMATVYLAEDERTGRRVALKLMEAHLADDETFVERFRREMKASASLTHENIVRIFDCDEDRGTYYMAAELVDGGTLRDLLAKMGQLPAALAALVLKQCLAGLAHAHERGIVHRDLKPANVMLTRDGIVKIGDFGIAKTNNDTTLTQTGTLFGTPAYMSPEQATGKVLDQRSDLFSIGTVVYELLTGRNPFTHENISTSLLLVSRAKAPPIFEALPVIPPLLEDVLERLMLRDPARRYQSAGEALADLEPLARLIERAYPDLVARAVTDAGAVRDEILRDQAAREYERASALLRKASPARLEAAFRLYKATLLDASNYQAVNELTQLRIDHGFRFDPVDAGPIREVEAALVEKPDSGALLRRGADLSAAQRDLLGAAAFMKRYLKGQPGDLHMLRRLHEVVGSDPLAPYRSLVDSQSTPATVPGGPAIDTGAPDAASPAAVSDEGAPVPANVAVEFADLFQEGVRSLWQSARERIGASPVLRATTRKLGWFVVAVTLIAVLALGLRVTFELTRSSAASERSARPAPSKPDGKPDAPSVPRTTTATPAATDAMPEPAVGTWLAERAERQREKLEAANRKVALGKLEEGMAELSAVVILDPSSELAARALVQRAQVAIELGRPEDARRDLAKVLRRVARGDPLRKEAEALLARLAADDDAQADDVRRDDAEPPVR